MSDLFVACQHLEQMLASEEQRGSLSERTELTFSIQQREEIQHTLTVLEKRVKQYRQRLESLPPLPDRTCMRWAQQILCYPNGRILTVDTVFPGESAELLQVLVLDFAGGVRLHRCVATEYALSSEEMARFGISDQDIQRAQPLLQIWSQLLDVLHGCYLLACDLHWIGMVLEQEAHHFQLEVPALVGEDLLIKAIRFYQASGRTTLTGLCQLIGHPLSANAGIAQRARGQLALLEAMAQGITRSTGTLGRETDDRR